MAMSRERGRGTGLWNSLMQRMAILLLVVGLLPGCGQDAQQGPPVLKPSQVLADNIASSNANRNPIGPTVSIKARHPWRIAFLMKNFAWANPYWRRANRGADLARAGMGVSLRALGVEEYGIEAQIKSLDNLIREGRTDGLIIAPVDSNRLSPVVEKAVAAGIPVIVYDTPLNADGILTFVGFDNFKAGTLLGRWVVEQLEGQGNVLILEGPAGNQNALDRRNGMMAGLREGDINVLGLKSGGWRRGQARHITTAWLERHRHIDAILAADDEMALGAADAVQAAARQGIIITGFDANADALLAIRGGTLHATIDQQPELLARSAMQLMVRHLESGTSFPPIRLWDNIQLITTENVVNFQK
jgi:ribose transport system substrate-binding protein